MLDLATLVSAIRAQDAAAARECPVPQWLGTVDMPLGFKQWRDFRQDVCDLSDDAARLVVAGVLWPIAVERCARGDAGGRLKLIFALTSLDHLARLCGYTLPTEEQP